MNISNLRNQTFNTFNMEVFYRFFNNIVKVKTIPILSNKLDSKGVLLIFLIYSIIFIFFMRFLYVLIVLCLLNCEVLVTLYLRVLRILNPNGKSGPLYMVKANPSDSSRKLSEWFFFITSNDGFKVVSYHLFDLEFLFDNIPNENFNS